jgi:RNA polymerase sigma-70 factor (ECF subfamily)
MDQTNTDRDRFEQLFRSYHAAVHSFTRRRMASEAVEDVVSETFLVAWRRLGDVPDEPLAWLLSVARNVIATKLRGDARRLRLQARAQAEYQLPAAEPLPGHADTGLITAALGRLNEADREALTLIAWDGLTPSQAAAVLDIPVNRFRVRLHRAGRRLRWALEVESEGASPSGESSNATNEPSHLAHSSHGAIA